jgi:hypothetical protein
MMRQGGIASSPVGIHADPTRTEHFAVANFEKTSFKFIGHIFSFYTNSIASASERVFWSTFNEQRYFFSLYVGGFSTLEHCNPLIKYEKQCRS